MFWAYACSFSIDCRVYKLKKEKIPAKYHFAKYRETNRTTWKFCSAAFIWVSSSDLSKRWRMYTVVTLSEEVIYQAFQPVLLFVCLYIFFVITAIVSNQIWNFHYPHQACHAHLRSSIASVLVWGIWILWNAWLEWIPKDLKSGFCSEWGRITARNSENVQCPGLKCFFPGEITEVANQSNPLLASLMWQISRTSNQISLVF